MYTLSISENKETEIVECRIFCSKLLTNHAVKTFVRSNIAAPTFQPILQVTQIEGEDGDGGGDIDTALGDGRGRRSSTTRSNAASTSTTKRVRTNSFSLEMMILK